MADPLAVVFDCDGVLASNGSSWQSIHENFGTENKEMFTRFVNREIDDDEFMACLLYTSPSPRDLSTSRMPSSA